MRYATHYTKYHKADIEYFDWWAGQNAPFIKKLIGVSKNGPILDVGCGFGLLVNALLKVGCQNVAGIDVDESQIEVARAFALPCQKVTSEDQRDFFAERPNFFEVITLFDVLEHIPVSGQIDFLAMLRSSITKGGRLIIQTPNASSPIAAHMRYIDHTHTSSFTVDSLSFALESAGFERTDIGDAADEMSMPAGRNPMRHIRRVGGHAVRALWRILYLGEFGRPGMKIPLGRNLMAIAYNL